MISQRLASFIYFDENAIFKARKGNWTPGYTVGYYVYEFYQSYTKSN